MVGIMSHAQDKTLRRVCPTLVGYGSHHRCAFRTRTMDGRTIRSGRGSIIMRTRLLIVAVVTASTMITGTGQSTGLPDRQSKIIPDEVTATESWNVDTASDQ